MKWLNSNSPDAICLRHAITGLVVGIALSMCISLVRGQPSTTGDAHYLKMSLLWLQGCMPALGAIVGSLVGLVYTFLRGKN